MLRRFLFTSQISDAIAHTFNSLLGYSKELSKDKIGTQTRQIQQGRGIFFDGVNDIAQVANFATATSKVTAWYFVAAHTSTFSLLFEYSIGGNRYGFFTHFESGVYRFGVISGSLYRLATTTIPVNTRHHVYFDAATITLSVGGVPLSYQPFLGAAAATSANVLRLGFSTVSGFPGLGSLYDVRVYSVSKDTAQQKFIRNGGIDNTGLLAHYKLDESVGTIAFDSSGNARHLTLFNGPTYITLTNGRGSEFQNTVGYNLSGSTFIPRNEAIPTQDVLGNPLVFSGRVKYDAQLRGRYFFFNGTNSATLPTLSTQLQTGDGDFAWFFNITNFAGGGLTPVLSTQGYPFTGFIVYLYENGQFQLINVHTSIVIRQSAANVIPVGQTGHVSVMKVAGSYQLYLNNVSVPLSILSGGSTNFSSGGPLRVGYRDFDPAIRKSMNIRDIRLYTNSKTETERQNIMNGGSDFASLVARYKMESTFGGVEHDSSGNGHHLLLSNNPARLLTKGFGGTQYLRRGFSTLGWINNGNRAEASGGGIVFPGDFIVDFVYTHTNVGGGFRTVMAFNYNASPGGLAIYILNNRFNIWRGSPYVDMQVVGPTLTIDTIYRVILQRVGSTITLSINGAIFSIAPYALELGGAGYFRLGQSTSGFANIGILREIKITIGTTLTHYYKANELSGSTIFDSIGTKHLTITGTAQRNTQVYPRVGTGDNDPRSTVSFLGDNQSLLPTGQADFNYGLAPELIRRTVPTSYVYGNTLPPTMTKSVQTSKEKDFIILS